MVLTFKSQNFVANSGGFPRCMCATDHVPLIYLGLFPALTVNLFDGGRHVVNIMMIQSEFRGFQFSFCQSTFLMGIIS